MRSKVVVHRVVDQESFQTVLAIRREVFIEEQGVAEHLEIDGGLADATYFLVIDGDEPVATGRYRLVKDAVKFERIATLAHARGRGFGRALMEAMQIFAKKDHPGKSMTMSSQCSAIGFYTKLGWRTEGAKYDDAGILHQDMVFSPSATKSR